MSQLKLSGRRRSLSFSLLVLIRPSADWVRPICIRESNLLYSIYQFKCYLTLKHPYRHTQKNV